MRNCGMAVFLAVTLVFGGMPLIAMAGDLEPGAPPGSTMHTLKEVYQELQSVNSTLEGCDPCDSCGTGAPADPRFTDHGDGTVTDNRSGLMWTKNAGIGLVKDQPQSVSACEVCTEGGYDDWRLPSIREFISLIDYAQYNPALPERHPFEGVLQPVCLFFWSSTRYENPNDPNDSWDVTLLTGRVGNTSGYLQGCAWCVRDPN